MSVLDEGWRVPPPSAVAIGVFDGVHLGHRRVVEGLVERAGVGGWSSGVLTFDPHPVEVLAPSHAPVMLTTVERRIDLLLDMGIDWVGVLDLTEIRTMSPGEFVTRVLIDRASTRLVSVGDDFRFGHDRIGDVAELRRQGGIHGFEVAAVDLVGDEHGPISSTRIRALIGQGDVADAARLLGRPHRLRGEVQHGDARGRSLGYPTANLVPSPRIALPGDGIYAVRVREPVTAEAVASIGVRPTFGSDGIRLVEVHLFDFDADLYGSMLTVDFIDRLRGEERFDSVEELVEQMERDSRQARRRLRVE